MLFASPSEHDEEVQLVGGRTAGKTMGSAFHALMETIDLDDATGWDRVVAAVAADFSLTAKQRKQLRRWLDNFAQMPCYEHLQGRPCWREVPFTYAAADGKVYRGQLDLLAETAAGLLILDYKTDSVAPDELKKRVEFYRRQGEIYRDAVRALRPDAAQVTMSFCFVEARQEVVL